MNAILIRGGSVVEVAAPGGLTALDVRVHGSRIIEVGPDLVPEAGEEVVDADGLYLFPGAVDSHTHLRDPGFTEKEDFESGTAAAAAGGVTTVVAQPNTMPVIDRPVVFEQVRAIGERASRVDFGIAAAVTVDNLHLLTELDELGAAAFEVALGGPPGPEIFDDPVQLYRAFEALRPRLARIAVMAVDQRLRSAARTRAVDTGRRDAAAFADAYPPVIEANAVATACTLALAVDVALHFRQLHSALGIQVLRGMQSVGARVAGEVTSHHLLLDRAALERLGPEAQMIPPLRPGSEQRILMEALLDDALTTVGSDHAPHTDAEKARGRDDIWASPPGTPGLETLLPALLTLAARGACSYGDVARWASTAPARCFGFGDRKGRIAAGMDADIVLVDPTAARIYDPFSQHSRSRTSPFRGERLVGSVEATLAGGRWVYRNGQVLSSGGGAFVRPVRHGFGLGGRRPPAAAPHSRALPP